MNDGDFSMTGVDNYEFMPYDDKIQQQAATSNESSDVRSTAAAEVIGVALYPVVTWFAALLTLLSVGLVGNIVVLVATTVFDDTAGRRGRLRRASTVVVANLGVALVVLCVFVGPLEFAVVAENYVKRSVSSFICRAAAAAYHLLAGTVVSCLVLYSLIRRRRLQHVADSWRSSSSRALRSAGDEGTCSASFRRQLATLRGSSAAAGAVDVLPNCRRQQIGVTMVVGTAAPWLFGALCSLLASVNYDSLVDFEVCRQSVVYRRQINHGHYKPALSWTGALAVTYWLVIMLAGAWLFAGYFWYRKLLASTLLRREPPLSRDRSGLSRDEGRRRTSCISAAGASSPDIAVGDAGEMSRHEPSNSSRKKRLSRKQSAELAIKSSQDKRELEEDDDTFDIKMRMKFQKKSRSSGRRHTVANIGLPSLSGRLRRGSLSDTGLTAVAGISPSGSGSGATTPEYHYVRKWSVDITALANQLENPKAAVAGRSGSYQFAELQGALKTSPGNPSRRSGSPVAARPTLPCIIAEVETTDQEAAEKDSAVGEEATAKQSSRSHDDRKPMTTESRNTDSCSPAKRYETSTGNEVGATRTKNPDIDEEDEEKTGNLYIDEVDAAPSKSTVDGSELSPPAPVAATASVGSDTAATSKRRSELRKCHNAVEQASSLPVDPPSIIVSGLNVDDHEPCSTNTDEDDDYSGKGDIWTTSGTAANHDVIASEERSSMSTYDDDQSVNDGHLRRVKREMERAVRTCGMLMICAALVLPYACVSLWNGVTTSRYVGYNLSLAATALMTLTAAIIPPLLVWSDRSLRARILRMWALATRLRCVCYCNVGRGKSCLQRSRTIRDL